MKLAIISTPIGNLKDITLRALDTLQTVDFILCEDTRRAQKLKTHFALNPPLISFHEHNEKSRIPEILAQMEQGKTFALISDAGSPVLSDPGRLLIEELLKRNIPFTYLPGPTAILSALILSGFPVQPFTFFGFLPRGAGRSDLLERMAGLHEHTLVLFESPDRVVGLVREIGEILGNRPVAVCREMTKLHEEVIRGHASEILGILSERKLQGEFTLVIGPGVEEKTAMSDEAITSRFQQLLKEGLNKKEALRKTAKESGRSRNEIYDMLMKPGGSSQRNQA